jgi:PleD family two-component response regulator
MHHHPVHHPKADILIVDDVPDNIRTLSTLLTNKGYNVRKALSGHMALFAIKNLRPDLILLDINMPGMNGYEVCRHLKGDVQTSSIPIIFLSAWDDIEDKVKAFQVGGADYITKPFQLEEVLVRVQNQLTIRTLQTQLQSQTLQLQQALKISNSLNSVLDNVKSIRQYTQHLLRLIECYQQEYPQLILPIQTIVDEINLELIIPNLRNSIEAIQTGVEELRSILLVLNPITQPDESD